MCSWGSTWNGDPWPFYVRRNDQVCGSELSRGLGGPRSRGMTHRCPHPGCAPGNAFIRDAEQDTFLVPSPSAWWGRSSWQGHGDDSAEWKPCDTDVTQQLSSPIRVLCEWATAKGAQKVPCGLRCCCGTAHGRWTQRSETAPSNPLKAHSANSGRLGWSVFW